MMVVHKNPEDRPADFSFGFRCRRSGRCCQVRGGVAWVSGAEQAALARHMDLGLTDFQAKHTRQLPDPRTGEMRSALLDAKDGSCALLEDGNQCSVYEARPSQCREFPFWDSIAKDAKAFERTRQLCPGIEAIPTPAFTERAATEVQAHLEHRDEAASDLCPHPAGGRNLHISKLEFEVLKRAARGLSPASQAPGSCPLWTGQTCANPKAKPVACRSLGEAASEHGQAQLRELHKRLDYPHKVGTMQSFGSPDAVDLATLTPPSTKP